MPTVEHHNEVTKSFNPARAAAVSREISEAQRAGTNLADPLVYRSEGDPGDRFRILRESRVVQYARMRVGDEVTRREIERIMNSRPRQLVFERVVEPVTEGTPEQAPPLPTEIVAALWSEVGEDSDALLARLVEIGTSGRHGKCDRTLALAPETGQRGDAAISTVRPLIESAGFDFAPTADAILSTIDSLDAAPRGSHDGAVGPSLDAWLDSMLDGIGEANADQTVALLNSQAPTRKRKGLDLAAAHVRTDFRVWRAVDRLSTGDDEIAEQAARLRFSLISTAATAPPASPRKAKRK